MKARYWIAVGAASVLVCAGAAVAVNATHDADARAAANPIAAADPGARQAYFAEVLTTTLRQISHDLDDPDTGWAGTTHAVNTLKAAGALRRYAEATDVYGVGSPLTLYTVDHPAVAGASLDLYHPGGWRTDLLLLGPAYRSLAPTRWVERSTAYPPHADPCTYPGPHQYVCWIQTALTKAAHAPADQRHYQLHRDSTTNSINLQTDARLRDILSTGLIALPDNELRALPPVILNAHLKISISVQQNTDHVALKQIHVYGSATSAGVTVTVDDGYDWHTDTQGQAGPADFPGIPLLFDVTRLTTPAQVARFDRDYRRLRAKKIGR
jgi:hypothetical protein